MENKRFLWMAMAALTTSGMAANYTNFIIINLDDAGYGDFSYNGAYGYRTPNIDRMAAEGVRFTHFLAGQPISGASRAGLLTGCYPNRIGFAGAPLPNHKIAGVSLLPLIKGEKDANPRESFVYYLQKNDLEAVTDGRFKLIFPHRHVTYRVYVPGNDGQPGNLTNAEVTKTELYDLRRDPGERYDVISQYPEVAARLMKIADEMRKDLGDDLRRVKGVGRREPGRLK